ncbi:hypothetical protein [Gemmobacter caeni]|nr:hypothetical protein [Gemmobacter caeni]
MTGKPSRREREESRRMRRLLLIGGGATALAGLTSAYLISRPPEIPSLSGRDPIGTRLSRIGPTPHHQQLTGSGADLLVISDTGCAFCREFVRTGLDPLIRFAEARGLAAAYLSVGYGRSGLISTVAAACLEREGSRLAPPDRVRALFEMTASVPTEGGLEELILPQARLLGASRVALSGCVAEEGLQFRDRFESTRREFALERTPTFFLAAPGDPGRVLKIEGFTGAGAMIRRLERGLEVAGGRA